MRRRTFARDLMGTLAVLIILLVITFGIIWGEKGLEAFKSH
jgi:hypothetical protein